MFDYARQFADRRLCKLHKRNQLREPLYLNTANYIFLIQDTLNINTYDEIIERENHEDLFLRMKKFPRGSRLEVFCKIGILKSV